MDLLDRARELAGDLVGIRRDLHRHPELSYQEVRTAEVAAREAESAGFQVRTGVARTGVVADLDNGPGPTVAVRADMDALPIQESSEVAYASTVPGVMHACGHDAHTAGLVGAARLLARLLSEGALPPGRIRLLFQPAEEQADEEGKSGARRMVEEGVMNGVDAVLGLHVGGDLPMGKVFLREGAFFAGSDEVFVTVRGRSAHAARPDEGVDAVALAALGVVAAQQVVARRIAPGQQGVLTFGTIQGGTAPNILADRVRLTGTLRYLDPRVRERLQEGVREAFQGAAAMGGAVEVEIREGYPPVVNDARVTGWMREAARDLVGPDGVLDAEPTLASEDFSFLAGEAPGAFLWLGAAPSRPRSHHHPEFDIDEGVLPLGAALLAAGAVRILNGLAGGSGSGPGN